MRYFLTVIYFTHYKIILTRKLKAEIWFEHALTGFDVAHDLAPLKGGFFTLLF